MTTVNITEANSNKDVKEDTYHSGQYFVLEEIGCGHLSLCLLVRLGYDTYNLINLEGGNRWGDPVTCDEITHSILSDLIGCEHTFTLVKDIDVKYSV